MLATIGGILMTLIMFCGMAVMFVVALIPQVWTLMVQSFGALQNLFA